MQPISARRAACATTAWSAEVVFNSIVDDGLVLEAKLRGVGRLEGNHGSVWGCRVGSLLTHVIDSSVMLFPALVRSLLSIAFVP